MKKDTLVVACGGENFDEVFMKECAWYPIPLSQERIPTIKYIAAYRKLPVAGITHVAEVKEIIKLKDVKHRFKVFFKDKPKKISKIPMGKDQRNIPQNPRYSSYIKLLNAKNMDEIY